MQKCFNVATWPLPVNTSFSEMSWEALWTAHKTMNPISGSPVRWWTEQETPTTRLPLPFMLVWWTLRDSLSTKIPWVPLLLSTWNTSCPSNQVSYPVRIPRAFSPHLAGRMKTPPFCPKGGKRRPCFRQLCHYLTDQVGLPLTWVTGREYNPEVVFHFPRCPLH